MLSARLVANGASVEGRSGRQADSQGTLPGISLLVTVDGNLLQSMTVLGKKEFL